MDVAFLLRGPATGELVRDNSVSARSQQDFVTAKRLLQKIERVTPRLRCSQPARMVPESVRGSHA
jgi:hypothetical protein